MAGNETLTRIGRGVPGANKPPERKLSLRATLVLAAAVLIAVAALVVTMYNPPKAKVDTADLARGVECTNITRAYDAWWPGRERLDILPYVDPAVAESFLKTLNDDAQAFTDASAGYADDLSKDLALAVIELREQLSQLQFQQSIQRTVDEALLKKAQTAWDTAGQKYRAFTEGFC